MLLMLLLLLMLPHQVANNKLDCSAIASNIGGKVVPNPDICDELILRQAPQIKGGPYNNISLQVLSN
jgi:hypothetical protein